MKRRIKRATAVITCLCLVVGMFSGCGKTAGGKDASQSKEYLSEDDIMQSALKPNILFRDNMVLQQGESVPVWGTGPDGEQVSVSFHGQEKTTSVENGKWMISLDPMEVVKQGEDMIISCGKEKIKLQDILVGEVWLATGQSNMAFIVNYLQEPTKSNIKNDCDYPNIRVFTQNEHMSLEQQEQAENGKWRYCNSLNVGDFPTLGVLFARGLIKEMDTPVGIIAAAHGGVRIETFIDAQLLIDSEIPVYGRSMKNAYNAMIYPLIPFKFRGVLWYQGEGNSVPAEYNQYYSDYMQTLVSSWRNSFKNPNMPFIQVQLPSYGLPDADFTEIRFEQMSCDESIDNFYTTINYDTGNPDDIHPSDKLLVGARMVNMALEKVYGKDIKNLYPALESAKVSGSNVILTFKDVDQGLLIRQPEVNGLEICGEDGVYHQAVAEVTQTNQLTVSCNAVKKPVGVRYGCKSNMLPAQFCDANINPVKPFRVEPIA